MDTGSLEHHLPHPFNDRMTTAPLSRRIEERDRAEERRKLLTQCRLNPMREDLWLAAANRHVIGHLSCYLHKF